MSGIFGIFNRNGKAVDEQVVKTMLDATSYWKPDEQRVWVNGSVVLIHTMLWSTPESKFECLPVQNDAYVLIMDARIDNRNELSEKLDLPNKPICEIGDSEFILAAYKKWGEECPKYLLGDFVFVVWDEKKQQLFCVRDHIGIKSFYYYLDDNQFIFSNDIRSIIMHPSISKSINDEAVVSFLSMGHFLHREKTFYESLHKLPPASIMIISSCGRHLSKYWHIEKSPQVKYSNIDEYAKELRKLLNDAVKKRLRSEYPIVSHLSGGLDSSTIAVIAARHLQKQGKKLHAYNWVPAPNKEADLEYYEWSNSHEIAELENIEHSYIDLTSETIKNVLLNRNIAIDGTEDLIYEFLVREKAKKLNAHTILSGWGGDELITYFSVDTRYSTLIDKRKFIELIKDIYKTSRKNRKVFRSFLSKIYYYVLIPLVPKKLYCFLPKIKCLRKNYLMCATEDFAKKVHNTVIPKTQFNMNSIRDNQLDLYNYGHIVERIESWNSLGFKDRVEYAYPLLDKRLVEFAIGIPPELYYQNTQTRYLFRYSIEGILPERIRWGHYKYEPKRIDQLYQICEAAVKLWLENTKINKRLSSKYIRYESIEKLINSLDTKIPINIEEKHDRIDIIFLSILILNLNNDILS